jgi:hypothetical protein
MDDGPGAKSSLMKCPSETLRNFAKSMKFRSGVRIRSDGCPRKLLLNEVRCGFLAA